MRAKIERIISDNSPNNAANCILIAVERDRAELAEYACKQGHVIAELEAEVARLRAKLAAARKVIELLAGECESTCGLIANAFLAKLDVENKPTDPVI